MTKEESLSITAHIGQVIAQYAPSFSYTEEEVRKAKETYSAEKLDALYKEGFYNGDFEHFFVLLRFCNGLGLWNRADRSYLQKLFSESRKLSPLSFSSNPYYAAITIPTKELDNISLRTVSYEKGEFFQYDMPTLTDEIVVPKIGFFPSKVSFPAIYEGDIPWVSVCPSEIHSMAPDIPRARGNVLVLGLGLGYYPFMISSNPQVESITVVEKNPTILRLFRDILLPQFPHGNKIRLVEADAFDFLSQCTPGTYDFCYADIWEGWDDGAKAYEMILPHEKRLAGCEFRYWIHKEILWYREQIKQGKV